MRPLIMVTGFGPYLGHGVNPSEPLAQAIASVQHATHDFASLSPLPVELERAAEMAREEAAKRGASAILSLGVLMTSPKMRIESVAKNLVVPIEPAGAGSRIIVDGAPEILRTQLEIGAIARSLEANGIPWEQSDDAGTWVCNDLYFRLLEAHMRHRAPPIAFVHVPLDAHEIPRVAEALAEGMVHALLSLPSSMPPHA